jgi:hypothetical protein
MLVPFNEVDFLADARQVITEQFKEKVVIDKYLQLLFAEDMEIQNQIRKLLQERSIDEAVGEQLDIIGRIVGQPRELVSLDVYKYFAFKFYPNGDTFGDLFDPSVGGVFYSEGTPTGGNYILDDNSYRLFIKSKIVKNQTASTPEELITFLSYLYGADTPIYIKEGDTSFVIYFGRPLTSLERNLLSFTSYDLGYESRLVPKTVGVGVGYAYFKANRFFAFQGVPNAKGFKDADATVGWGEEWGVDYGGVGLPSELIGGYLASYLDIT